MHPQKHAPLGRRHLPTRRSQTCRDDIPALLIARHLAGDVLFSVAQGDDGGNLHRLEDPVIVVALDAVKRADDCPVSQSVADAPAGHVVGLRKRSELAAHFTRALRLQEAGMLESVKGDPSVGEIVHDDHLEALGNVDHGLEERQLDAPSRGVVRIVEEQHLGPGVVRLANADQFPQVVVVIMHVEPHRRRPGQHDAVGMNGVGRRGNDGRIPHPEQGQAQMGESLLGADRTDDLVIGIEQQVIAGLVVCCDLSAQIVDARCDRIAVIAAVLDGLRQFVDDLLRRGITGIAHGHVDQIHPRPPFFLAEEVDLLEHVVGQLGHPLRQADRKG